MNKFIAFGVAVMLCVAAAGFGAYMALRPQPAGVSEQTGAAATSEPSQAGAAAPAPPVTTTENVVADPAAGTTQTAAAGTSVPVVPPAAAPAPVASAAPAVTEKPARPASRPDPPPASANTAAGTGAGAAAATPPASENAAVLPTPPAAVAPPPVPEPAAPPPPPQPPPKTFEELVVSADAVLGLQIDSTVSSEVAKIEDPVEARVTRDVRVGRDVAIPSGTRVLGSVVQVERGGKMKSKARIGIRFHTLVMADGARLRMNTEAVYREGKSPGQESAVKVGAAAAGGAIVGAIIGGGKGAAIGGSVGAAGGTAAVMAGDRNAAVLSSGTALTVRLREPVTVTVERDSYRD